MGEAGDIPVLGAGERGGADLGVGALADHVELALELRSSVMSGRAADEDLAHERLADLAVSPSIACCRSARCASRGR
jgi:hypothetical protein